MDLLTISGIISVAFTGFSEAVGVLPDSLDAALGGSVMFNTTLSSTETPTLVTWSFSGDSNRNEVPIIIYNNINKKNNTGPQYEGRIRLFRSTGSLELENVSNNDRGTYKVSLVITGGEPRHGSTDLRVHVPITGAQLTPSSEDLLEFNSSVTFSCSVSSGSSLSFLWQNISSEISASDGVRITDGGAKLTVLNVTRYDQGPFRCSVFNPVSRVLTDPLTLSISYGPGDVDLQVSPSQEHFEEGSNIRLSCSSSSSPPARLQWFVNSTLLPNTGAELVLTAATEAQSGAYSCQAFNSKTLRYRTSAAAVTVLVPITAAQLSLSSEDLLEFNSSVTFSCSVSSGSSLSFLWQNISSEISASDGVRITDGGAKLTVLNVTRYDQGPFRCSVFNPVSRVLTDPLTLSISYGPDDVDVQVSPSQEHFEEGSNIRLSCSSSSSPPARLQWFVNGTLLPNTGAELVLTAATEAQSGAYSCQAFNSKTLRYRTSSAAVTVLASEVTSPCSTGCIAAIVAACSVVIIAAAVGGVCFYRRGKTAQEPPDNNRTRDLIVDEEPHEEFQVQGPHASSNRESESDIDAGSDQTLMSQ